jgi:hypothetical protein
MKRIFANLVLAALLGGCGTTIKNQYTVTGDRNTFRCDSAAGQDKVISPSLGASMSATAAASQQGDATNSGSSESSAQ